MPTKYASNEPTSPSANDQWSMFNNWHAVLPPNRPGRADLAILSRVAGSVAGGSALILGATPEFRTITARHRMNTTLVDRNEAFATSLDSLVVEFPGRARHEKLIVGDWLEVLPELEGQFDLVASDFTLGNVTREDQSALQDAAARCLRRGGVLYDRVVHHRAGVRTHQWISNTFRSLPCTLGAANLLNASGVFCGETTFELGRVDTSESMRRLCEEVPWMTPFARLLLTYVSPPGSQWSYDGRYRDPLTIYREALRDHKEHEFQLPGFGRNVSSITGTRR